MLPRSPSAMKAWEGDETRHTPRGALHKVDDKLSRLAHIVGTPADTSAFAFDADFKRKEALQGEAEEAAGSSAQPPLAVRRSLSSKWGGIASRVNSHAARVTRHVAVAAVAFMTREEGEKQQEQFKKNLAAIKERMAGASKWDPKVTYKILVPGKPELEKLATNSYRHYRFDVPPGTNRILIYLLALSGDPDLYASFLWEHPSIEQHHWKSDKMGDDEIEILDDHPDWRAGPLYIGVFGKELSDFRLSVTPACSVLLRAAWAESGRCTPKEPAYFRVLLEDPRQSMVFRLTLKDGPTARAAMDDDSKPRLHVSTRYRFPDGGESFEGTRERVTARSLVGLDVRLRGRGRRADARDRPGRAPAPARLALRVRGGARRRPLQDHRLPAPVPARRARRHAGPAVPHAQRQPGPLRTHRLQPLSHSGLPDTLARPRPRPRGRPPAAGPQRRLRRPPRERRGDRQAAGAVGDVAPRLDCGPGRVPAAGAGGGGGGGPAAAALVQVRVPRACGGGGGGGGGGGPSVAVQPPGQRPAGPRRLPPARPLLLLLLPRAAPPPRHALLPPLPPGSRPLARQGSTIRRPRLVARAGPRGPGGPRRALSSI